MYDDDDDDDDVIFIQENYTFRVNSYFLHWDIFTLTFKMVFLTSALHLNQIIIVIMCLLWINCNLQAAALRFLTCTVAVWLTNRYFLHPSLSLQPHMQLHCHRNFQNVPCVQSIIFWQVQYCILLLRGATPAAKALFRWNNKNTWKAFNYNIWIISMLSFQGELNSRTLLSCKWAACSSGVVFWPVRDKVVGGKFLSHTTISHHHLAAISAQQKTHHLLPRWVSNI